MRSSFEVLAFLLLSNILSISTATRAIEPECGSCTKPPVIPVVPVPPVTVPKVPVIGVGPPVTVPPVTVPVIGTGPIIGVLPPVTVPPVTVPVIGTVPIIGAGPSVTVPKLPIIGDVPVIGVVPLPPAVITTPKKGKKPCAPPANKKATCPVNTLKLGACASLLGGTSVSIGLGDLAANKCCPIISGLADAEAAACLCTTLKIKTLNLKIYVPVALQLLVTCGKTPPPGFTCAV